MKYLFLVWVLIFSLVAPSAAISDNKPLLDESLYQHVDAEVKQPYYLISGLGTIHHPVSTSNPQAQKFFDQGLNLIYAFNHDEAVRSFQYAAKLDPHLAIAYWGVALALGPNINSAIDPNRELAAYQAIHQALALSTQASTQERDYITALAKRYSQDTDADLYQLAVDYAKAMGNLVKRYPDDLDAATLYAESLMDLHPWQHWTKDGKPQPDTEKIVAVLESVLKRNPNHAGANHYYIHAVEASPSPERALVSANRLGTLAPAAGHLVHMPSHIYFRVGDYQGAMQANEQAIAQDDIYIKKYQVQGTYPMMYYNHNVHFLMVASSMAGRYEDALKSADKLVANATAIDPYAPMLEGFLGSKMLIQTRFSDWDAILKTPAPEAKLPTTTALWHFARGMAIAATGKLENAASESRALLAAKQGISTEATIGFSPASNILDIASKVLDAKIARENHDYESAIQLLEKAVVAEDALNYVEPPDWYFPTRESLGAVLLAKGDYREAEKVFRADLKKYPHNGRSLFGLQATLQALGKDEAAQLVKAELETVWKGDVRQLKIATLVN
ncbi:MAG: tetratricopeptide repeat protein [Nostoc sp. DedQUE08]|uniref:tetratricopeptide repeat protein n=1 Tax=Nostoc sp. DedQUE08 TaxID=3075393 RepID=UPI002AD39C42|nr:tetratricopeptide repeat protein [Nostoc sp. DedQUE08]MDZ8066328.1 tetratricopeptide repeat protein [Nostoc sp. DedQUE08]